MDVRYLGETYTWCRFGATSCPGSEPTPAEQLITIESTRSMVNSADSVSLDAPAKLNLGLRILCRREDGYHDILTTFLAVAWTDRLVISPADPSENGYRGGEPADTLSCTDPSIPTGASNLCIRAIQALRSWVKERDEAPAIPSLHVKLHKRIPSGAGLGGGSSDAAATLQAVKKICELNISDEDMQSIAVELGADVPFFLDPRPSLATGIGDEFRYLTARPGLPLGHILIAVPEERVSTAEAYKGVTPRPPDYGEDADKHPVPEIDGRRLAAAYVSTDPEIWRRDLVNDFEPTVFEQYPEIGNIKDEMYAAGALYASMSGSGSAVFGIFRTSDSADAAELKLREHPGRQVHRTQVIS